MDGFQQNLTIEAPTTPSQTMAVAATPGSWTRRGTPAYRRISLGLFLAGFATFSLLYSAQPLLPVFARAFHVGPASSSLALSLTTGFLAVAILFAGAASEGLGRRELIFASVAAAALLNIVAGLAPSWPILLTARALEGVALGGVPAVAMAYLSEEIDPKGLGLAMGLYIAGNAFGGMFGRVIVGILTEFVSWRLALGTLGALDLAAALGFILLAPASRNFTRRPGFDFSYHWRAWHGHLRTGALPWLFLIGFLVMGAFVTVYNYAGFRLAAPPYGLGQTAISLIFAAYVFGIVASSAAGGLADRLGRGSVLVAGLALEAAGVALTLAANLAAIVIGIVLLTVGFFAAHAVASSWVGRLAAHTKGHAASLYLLAYYGGSSLMGSAGGWFWARGGWDATAGFTLALLAVALVIGGGLCRLRSAA